MTGCFDRGISLCWWNSKHGESCIPLLLHPRPTNGPHSSCVKQHLGVRVRSISFTIATANMLRTFRLWPQVQASKNWERPTRRRVRMVFAKGIWAAFEENVLTILSFFMAGIWRELSANIPITSIRNDLIKESVNRSPYVTTNLRQTQLEISHPRLSLDDYILAIPWRLARNNLYPSKLKLRGDCITMINGPIWLLRFYSFLLGITDKQFIISKKHPSESVLSIERTDFWRNLLRKPQNIWCMGQAARTGVFATVFIELDWTN